jgi:hypothetical protein
VKRSTGCVPVYLILAVVSDLRVISAKLDADDYARIAGQADAAGKTVSAFVRELLREARSTQPPVGPLPAENLHPPGALAAPGTLQSGSGAVVGRRVEVLAEEEGDASDAAEPSTDAPTVEERLRTENGILRRLVALGVLDEHLDSYVGIGLAWSPTIGADGRVTVQVPGGEAEEIEAVIDLDHMRARQPIGGSGGRAPRVGPTLKAPPGALEKVMGSQAAWDATRAQRDTPTGRAVMSGTVRMTYDEFLKIKP